MYHIGYRKAYSRPDFVFSSGLKFNQKPVKVFRLPEFPPPLAYHYVQNYYQDMVVSLGKAISTTPPDDSSLLAR